MISYLYCMAVFPTTKSLKRIIQNSACTIMCDIFILYCFLYPFQKNSPAECHIFSYSQQVTITSSALVLSSCSRYSVINENMEKASNNIQVPDHR
jgi:hypothetical protein